MAKGCPCVIQVILSIINFIFLALAVALIVITSMYLHDVNDKKFCEPGDVGTSTTVVSSTSNVTTTDSCVSEKAYHSAIGSIVMYCIIVIITFLGCFGAILESFCLLVAYAVIVGLLSIGAIVLLVMLHIGEAENEDVKGHGGETLTSMLVITWITAAIMVTCVVFAIVFACLVKNMRTGATSQRSQ